MNNNPLFKPSIVSERMSSLMLCLTEQARGYTIGHGLPAGALYLPDIHLVIATTPCLPPAFDRAMQFVGLKGGVDVLLAHHGFFPEVLDDVIFSFYSTDKHATTRHRLFIDQKHRTWLVGPHPGRHFLLNRTGLQSSEIPPFASSDERSDGLCRAAKLIANLTFGREVA